MIYHLRFFKKYKLLILTATAVFLATSFSFADQLTDVRNIIKEWVDTEKTISAEQQAWQENKSLLNDILTSLNTEEKILRETINNAKQDTTRADEERLELVSKRDEYRRNSDLLKENIGLYERQAILLVQQVPIILQDEMGPLINKLNKAGSSNYSLSERAQTLISILTAIQQFDNNITVANEIRRLNSGKDGEVKTLYIGLSRAFYVDNAKTTAGYGYPKENAPDGSWEWIEQTNLAGDILNAVNIYENRETPALISLPLQIKEQR